MDEKERVARFKELAEQMTELLHGGESVLLNADMDPLFWTDGGIVWSVVFEKLILSEVKPNQRES